MVPASSARARRQDPATPPPSPEAAAAIAEAERAVERAHRYADVIISQVDEMRQAAPPVELVGLFDAVVERVAERKIQQMRDKAAAEAAAENRPQRRASDIAPPGHRRADDPPLA